MDASQPSEALGDCYNLGDLERVVRRAINRYGSQVRIVGEGEATGVAVHLHFPKGGQPEIAFTKISAAYSDTPPENLT